LNHEDGDNAAKVVENCALCYDENYNIEKY
jgi:hypothetical protein